MSFIVVGNRISAVDNSSSLVVERKAHILNAKIQRIINIVLPFLTFCKPLHELMIIATGSSRTWKCLKESSNLLELAEIVSTVALSLFFPKAYFLISNLASLAKERNQLLSATKNPKPILHSVLKISFCAICVISVFNASPLVSVIILIANATFNVYEAMQEYSNGKQLEGAAKIIFAAIHIKLAMPHVLAIYRNWYGKKITQGEFINLFPESRRSISPKQKSIYSIDSLENDSNLIHVDEILKENNYTNDIEGLDLSDNKYADYNFSHLHFKNCSFEDSRIEHSFFVDTTFENCSMQNFQAIR